MSQHSSELTFRFQYVNHVGKSKGLWTGPGTLTEDVIQLENNSLSYEAIRQSTCRDRRLILTLNPQDVESSDIRKHLINNNGLILDITRAKATDLELFIDRISSRYLADRHRKELELAGKGREFRSVTCPHCDATVDVSLLNKTPYTYCRFCDTIFQENGNLQTVGRDYRLCDECGWFGRVQGYTEVYFYFLLIVYGFSWKRRHLCDNCVNYVFWKVLLKNLLFVLGIFPALWMKLRSLWGHGQQLQNLAKANALGKKGKNDQAEVIYAELHDHYPKHPGLLLNQGFGYLQSGDRQRAWHFLEATLRSCSNYGPAVRIMNRLQDVKSQSS